MDTIPLPRYHWTRSTLDDGPAQTMPRCHKGPAQTMPCPPLDTIPLDTIPRYHWTRYHDTIGHDAMAMMPCPTMDTMPWSNTMPLVSRTYDPEPGAGFKHWTTICPSLACFKRQGLFQKTGPVSYTPRRQNRLYSQRRGKISRYPCSLPKFFYLSEAGFAI